MSTAIGRARAAIVLLRLTGEEEYRHEVERIEKGLKEDLQQIEILRTHTCEFDEADYCGICGLDGRA